MPTFFLAIFVTFIYYHPRMRGLPRRNVSIVGKGYSSETQKGRKVKFKLCSNFSNSSSEGPVRDVVFYILAY